MNRVIGNRSALKYFLPLLVWYMVLILSFSSDILIGDENRYVGYARNMVQGFYTDADNPNLSNGPGYPIVLLPFVALGADLIIPKMLNGILVLIGVFFLYKTIQIYSKHKYAIIFACLVGLYPPLLKWMILLYSEALAFMLLCGFMYYFCYLFHSAERKVKSYLFAGFFLGFLVLTKVIFFHVMLCSAILLGILYLTKKRVYAKRSLLVLAVATIFASPFIIYAFSITGKPFYLGTRGGEVLYHRSSPYENEWGNWFSPDYILHPEMAVDQMTTPYQDLSKLSANHRDFYIKIESLSNIEKDSAFKAKAMENIKSHPAKYVKNTVSNIGRLLFHYPISYRSQNLNAFGYMIPNMFIVVVFLMAIYPAYKARKRIPFAVKAQLIFSLIYGCGMILMGGKGRYFIIMVPPLILFISYVFTKTLTINLNYNEEI